MKKKYFWFSLLILLFMFTVVACVPKETNNPPTKPSNLQPQDGATGVSITPTLSWVCEDPDGDALTYDLFFGTSESQLTLKANDLIENKYTFTEELGYNTTYYWKVKAKDGKGGEKEGPMWSFTTQTSEQPPNTPPTAPHTPSPADKATEISVTPILSWEAEDPDGDPLTYDLFFGTSESQLTLKANDLIENKYTFTEELEYGTTYYWKVNAKDGKGGETDSSVWNFTTMEKPLDIIDDLDDLESDDELYIVTSITDENITELTSDVVLFFTTLAEAVSAEADAKQRKRLQAFINDLLEVTESLRDYRVRLQEEYNIDTSGYRGLGAAESQMDLYSNRLKKHGQSWSLAGLRNMLAVLNAKFEGRLLEVTEKLGQSGKVVPLIRQKFGVGRVKEALKSATYEPRSGSLPAKLRGLNASGGLARVMQQLSHPSFSTI